LKINHRRHRDYFFEVEVEVEVEAEVEVKAEVKVEVEVEVEKSPHKAQKNTEIEGGSQKIEACRDARS
jgi:hypothetical protein